MKGVRVFFLGLMIVSAMGLGGCCTSGADVKNESKNVSTTLGKELQDLKDAYDQGIITEQQYRDAKEKLLKQRATDK